MEASKQNKHVVCNEDNDVDNNVDKGVDNCDDESFDDYSVYHCDDHDYNGDDGAEKHLTHLSQPANCCLMERNNQNKHVVCNKADDVNDNIDNAVDNSDNDSVDAGVNGYNDSADKHLTHLSEASDCCLMERSKQNKHVVCNEDNDVDNDVDNGVDNGDNDSVENGNDSVDDCDDGAYKHFTHLSQPADCCLIERSKQNQQSVCNKADDVDNGVDNGENNSVSNDDDDGIDNGDDSDVKHLNYLSQSADCCLMERRTQNKDVDCNKDNYVDNDVDNDDDNGDNNSVNYDSVYHCDDDSVPNKDDGANKHLTHISQPAD
eukprot:15363024-Ditylum_brightwellii.AAC.2